ncbi:ABC transporter substrate-binding protein [Streptomyces neyagawaensis]|uniref:ABC transporter substrate-binding protein n=1 Tax=Streptomyces neyagawaensis TaxID=42238 RepID=UPI0006E1237C|nr:ABC transporter substrate-binding protein [Streptomyces neyagawaensis]MCL6737474.1 ABC transporter substrate-binding protein [Streptomyces neyagawaensis]MDE1688241.1 ABC transporter substrate-binding protein [Streptomyces neyagawaensis]
MTTFRSPMARPRSGRILGRLSRLTAAAIASTLLFGTACARSTTSATDGVQAKDTAQAAQCPKGLTSKKATGTPIEIGNISSLTGPGTFPESSKAAKAVFDRLNDCGGVGGRPVHFTVEDDQGDPAVAAQAARRLVEQQKVVLNVGSASLLDCAVNASYYAKQKIDSIQGTGVDPVCYNSPNISPVNTGPFTGVTLSLYYASEILKKQHVCRVRLFDVPGFVSAFDAALTRWEKITGKKLTYASAIGKSTDDVTPLLLQAKKAGCEAVVVDGVEANALAVGKAVKANGLTGITWIGLTSYYTANVAKQLGATGDGLQANSEFEPFSNTRSSHTRAKALSDWRGLMQKNDIPLTSFAQGGYLAATIAQDTLLSMTGEVTRKTVTAQLAKLDAYDTPMIGSPYSFGTADKHAPNQSSKFMVLENGSWTVATDDWVTLPAGS